MTVSTVREYKGNETALVVQSRYILQLVKQFIIYTSVLVGSPHLDGVGGLGSLRPFWLGMVYNNTMVGEA